MAPGHQVSGTVPHDVNHCFIRILIKLINFLISTSHKKIFHAVVNKSRIGRAITRIFSSAIYEYS